MVAIPSQIVSLTIVYSTVYSGGDQTKHQRSASLAVGRGIQRWPVNSPQKLPVTRKMFPFDDIIIIKTAHIRLLTITTYIAILANLHHMCKFKRPTKHHFPNDLFDVLILSLFDLKLQSLRLFVCYSSLHTDSVTWKLQSWYRLAKTLTIYNTAH